jgi:hypothetical protein
LSLGFDLLEMALDNGTSHGADLVDLGDVNTLSGILALFVQPVLEKQLIWFVQ